MQMQMSPQQQAIIDAVATTGFNDIRVEARAGCGKTTTILAALPQAAQAGRVAFVAFNKSIATELQTKAPRSVDVSTLHSLGMRMLGSVLRGRLTIDADKTYGIVKGLGVRSDDIGGVMKLVGLCKNNLLTGSDEELGDLSIEHDIDVSYTYFAAVRTALTESVRLAKEDNVIDFDDMVWLPSVLDARSVPYQWVFVDEAQDVNAAQMDLILRVSKGGRVCFVGDPNQAIYAFRGADATAMDTLQAKLAARNPLGAAGVKTLGLTITRRCPKTIVSEAQAYVADFEAHPDAPDGVVRRSRVCEATTGDMVLSRVNAPLIPLAYGFIRAGIPVKVQGRDIGAGLVKLLEGLKPTSVDDLLRRIEEYRLKETGKLTRKLAEKPSKLEAALVAVNDRCDTLAEFAAGQTTVAGIVSAITTLFGQVASSKGVVLLSTIHKAKGLEAERVWYLQTKPMRGPQEDNLRYVAITRAKHELVYVEQPIEA